MTKIAFCFLIYNQIENEEIWKKFFEGIDKEKYSIYIHYKTKKESKYFEEYKLPQNKCIETKYADISMVRAMRILFNEAFIDELNYKFILVSQSCIPVKSFNYIYDFLTKDNNSYFNEAPQSACWPRVKNATKFIPREKIYKSSTWCILNREHVKLCLDNIKEEDVFSNVPCPDEHYFITLVKNKLNENVIYINESKEDSTTFANWLESTGSSPKTYTEITENELNRLLNSKSLFARKFANNFTVKCEAFNFISY
jgi:hypothetical protein